MIYVAQADAQAAAQARAAALGSLGRRGRSRAAGGPPVAIMVLLVVTRGRPGLTVDRPTTHVALPPVRPAAREDLPS